MLNSTNNFFKFLKKSAVVSLCTVMTIVTIPCINVFADELTTKNNDQTTKDERDIYSEKFEETVSIEGISYTYKYHYNENGDKSISILNNKTSTVETVTYDDESSNIYLDDEKIADVQTVDDDTDGSVITRSKRSTNGGFKCLGTRHKKITWKKAMTTGALAAVIATVMGGVGGIVILGKSAVVGLIIGSCGGVTLGTIASGSAGGTLHWTAWKKATRYIDHFKIDWSFRAPTDERYGTYHYYYSVK
ncbi:hypothetical protein GNF68_14225 [Clostridium perfringens]|uniref:Uncharacterized protein n=1 Tax=Clostridium perfringens TaxID=1502 RepID=A0AAW9HWT1_CLOPF|nr:hypothetical protein [Clostridium perfringens]MDZ4910189.1 hypothetical protein [Clostridium perfringens]